MPESNAASALRTALRRDGFYRNHYPWHAEVLARITDERERQEAKFPDQWAKFAHQFQCGGFAQLADGPRATALLAYAILAEEVGEVANAILERDAENLLTELIQVAAVATAFAEAILEATCPT